MTTLKTPFPWARWDRTASSRPGDGRTGTFVSVVIFLLFFLMVHRRVQPTSVGSGEYCVRQAPAMSRAVPSGRMRLHCRLPAGGSPRVSATLRVPPSMGRPRTWYSGTDDSLTEDSSSAGSCGGGAAWAGGGGATGCSCTTGGVLAGSSSLAVRAATSFSRDVHFDVTAASCCSRAAPRPSSLVSFSANWMASWLEAVLWLSRWWAVSSSSL
mmetsp:Transcript_28528/g.80492  ORF Transcript_28528/g.80492 Transcript_28528/m.80492 type:complete len:212 (+) Transcript_28528:684-1319(+)